MKIKLIDRLGDWNPQLLRELRAIRTSSLLIAAAISLLGQFLLLIHFQTQLPSSPDPTIDIVDPYCLPRVASSSDSYHNCLRDAAGNFIINWQLWWLSLFIFLSLFAILILLVGGVYLLVNNLATEQRRGTLNFIRLSPQSPQTILLGKLLGVPSLLYLVFILPLPLHLWAGLSAKIPLPLIFSFYIVVIAGCFFFYSAAILFGLVSSAFGFSPWLASAVVLLFLFANHYSVTGTLVDWLFLFSPNQIIPYLTEATHLNYNFIRGELLLYPNLYSNRWFNLPIRSFTSLFVSALLNYSLWSYWIWQAIKQRYSHPTKMLLTQKQSYFLIACFEIVVIGFTLVKGNVPDWKEGMMYNYRFLLIFNLVMFLILIISITPTRPALQYKGYERSFLKKLMKSALFTIGTNLAIASLFLIPWIVFNLNASAQIPAIFSLFICCNFILICAALTQTIVIRVTQKPALWIVGTFSIVTILPIIIFNLISRTSDNLMLWLFTPYAWVATESAPQINILFAIFVQWSILGLSSWWMVHNIKKIGESASKELFTRNALHRNT